MRRLLLALGALLLAGLAGVVWYDLLDSGGGQHRRDVDAAVAVTQGGDPSRGYALIVSSGCGACHEIAGIPAAHGKVGPPLEGFRERATIAGVMANSAPNLVRWIQHPRDVDAKTAMPDLGLQADQARDIASYLYAH
jgi:cytochrome c2